MQPAGSKVAHINTEGTENEVCVQWIFINIAMSVLIADLRNNYEVSVEERGWD